MNCGFGVEGSGFRVEIQVLKKVLRLISVSWLITWYVNCGAGARYSFKVFCIVHQMVSCKNAG